MTLDTPNPRPVNKPSILSAERIDELIATYRDGLLHDTLPFWIDRCVDREYGGFMFARDRDGTLIDTDKGMWQQCRFVWLLATLYNTVEKREEWLELAQHGIDFIYRHGFDDDGRMFFLVTRDGRPLRKRRYVDAEAFGVAAFAAYAQATGDARAKQQATQLFDLVDRYVTTPGLIPPKVDPQTRPSKALAVRMITIWIAQNLRKIADDPDDYTRLIDAKIEEIERDFMKPEYQAVMEMVGPNGEIADHFEGRMLCPGHSIETAWFILREAQGRQNAPQLITLGTTMLDWMWKWGWDEEYGGIIYYRDIKGFPVQEYWQDMKFWWPQNEAIIATLMAYQMTGNEKYAEWHQMIHDWTYRLFPDPEYGEWYGYLHRDGRISVALKGNLWKSAFHLPRMQLECWQVLEQIRAGRLASQ